jgi:hypothetical protein
MKPSKDHLKAAQTVACPVCRAPRGIWCSGGKVWGESHTAREVLAWYWDEVNEKDAPQTGVQDAPTGNKQTEL